MFSKIMEQVHIHMYVSKDGNFATIKCVIRGFDEIRRQVMDIAIIFFHDQ